MLDMTGLDDGFPVIGEIPKCSDILVCEWRVVCFLCLSFLSPCCIVLLCTILTFLSSIILNTL